MSLRAVIARMFKPPRPLPPAGSGSLPDAADAALRQSPTPGTELAPPEENLPLLRIQGPGDFPLDVVGESKYQDALNAIAGGKCPEGHDLVAEATLVLEDADPFDDQAVSVCIEGKLVGYLDRRLARQHRQQIAKAGCPEATSICRARIVGGWKRRNGDEGQYGVKLDVPLD